MEIGIYSFGDVEGDLETGRTAENAGQRLRDLVEEIELADQVGLDIFGVGEHHRPDYAVSSPAVVLAGAAVRTQNIRLTSAVTVLSSDDPVRVFQDFATLDQLSNGRAEVMAGRGSFTESFPLFGYDLDDYDRLFSEKLELLLKLREGERITWEGDLRPSISDRGVYPRPLQDRLPVWLAVGGSPNSAIRAAALGLPLALAIIGGMPERFVPFIDLYRDAARQLGRDPSTLKVGINSPGYIADTTDQAADEFFPGYAQVMTQIGRERGWGPMTRQAFDAARSKQGSLILGDPETVAQKILFEHELFKHDRVLIQLPMGAMPHHQVMHAIELLGTKVAPIVRKEVARRQAAASAAR